MPKNFLASWLLLLLRSWNAHGYQLIQTLTAMGLGLVDPATVYGTLRQLEEEGLITSTWDAAATGPARRVYTLSEAGERYLSLWAIQLGQYQAVPCEIAGDSRLARVLPLGLLILLEPTQVDWRTHVAALGIAGGWRDWPDSY